MESDPFIFESREAKKQYVQRMFGEIARRYDFFNHFLSIGFDYRWRKKAIERLGEVLQLTRSPRLLDVACGTGDLAFEAIRQIPSASVVGVDITPAMLDLFRQKVAERRCASIRVEQGDVEALQFSNASFDGVTIGFGTRNFTSLETAFSEIYRVLSPGGVLVNLELARPRSFPMKQMYKLYFDTLLPFFASKLSRHDSAYRYLPDSLRKFPDLESLSDIMTNAGFADVTWETMTMGIVAIHVAKKQS